MGRREAELCKQACNAYLAVRLSFFNEMANLCESMGLDYRAVARGLAAIPALAGSICGRAADMADPVCPRTAGRF